MECMVRSVRARQVALAVLCLSLCAGPALMPAVLPIAASWNGSLLFAVADGSNRLELAAPVTRRDLLRARYLLATFWVIGAFLLGLVVAGVWAVARDVLPAVGPFRFYGGFSVESLAFSLACLAASFALMALCALLYLAEVRSVGQWAPVAYAVLLVGIVLAAASVRAGVLVEVPFVAALAGSMGLTLPAAASVCAVGVAAWAASSVPAARIFERKDL